MGHVVVGRDTKVKLFQQYQAPDRSAEFRSETEMFDDKDNARHIRAYDTLPSREQVQESERTNADFVP